MLILAVKMKRPRVADLKLILAVFLLWLDYLEAVSFRNCDRERSSAVKRMKCERIKIPLCQKIGYNLTYVPNMFCHKTQMDAALVVHQFWPLVAINCSPDLRFFLCSTHAPMCEPQYGKPLYPCRSLCQRARDGCQPLMKDHGFSWPDYLNCDKFPKREDEFCMDKTNLTLPTKGTPSIKYETFTKPKFRKRNPKLPPQPTPPHFKFTRLKPKPWKTNPKIPIDNFINPTVAKAPVKFKSGTCGCTCEYPFVRVNQSLVDSKNELPACALPCKQYFFKRSEQNFTTFWITLWSVLCLLSTFVTCATALIDISRFQYPERPIVFIAFCYFCIALGYIIRLASGFESIACDSTTNLLRYSATGPAGCTAVFLLTYYFGMASWIWWVILSLNWFLSAGIKWSKEAIASYSQYFHFVAWLIPTIKSMAILAMAGIDSDPVSGLCYVGNHNNTMLTIFVIAPLLIYLMLSSSFLVAGLLAFHHIRRIMQRKGNNTQKLEKLLVKIGIFSVLYIVPATIVIICYFYEHNNRESWEKSVNCPCMPVRDRVTPKHYIFLVKYFMSLLVGLAVGFWLWGTKTINSWKKCINRLCEKRGETKNMKLPPPVSL